MGTRWKNENNHYKTMFFHVYESEGVFYILHISLSMIYYSKKLTLLLCTL